MVRVVTRQLLVVYGVEVLQTGSLDVRRIVDLILEKDNVVL